MQLYEQIRRDYFIKKQSIRSLAKQYRIHRREVRRAIQSPIPPDPKKHVRCTSIVTSPILAVIQSYLLEDLKAPKKQRHTCHRIYERLVAEHDYRGAEPTLRKHIASLRRTLMTPKEVFIIQNYVPGKNAEVDWYEAYIYIGNTETKLYIFAMRASYSGKVFHQAFLHATQQAFLTAHVNAFHYFGGVFAAIRYDNLTSAVKKVLQGRQRCETERFTLFRSHYLFESEFCQPGIKGAHEKGGIEGQVGYFRRNYLVPVPHYELLEDFNTYLKTCCDKEDTRCIHGKEESIGKQWHIEKASLQALPKYPFDLDEVHQLKVNNKSLITLHTNHYSVPTDYLMLTLEVRASTEHISAYHQNQCIASHPRCYLKHQTLLNMNHYLKALKHKPGALKHSLALTQARHKKEWPECYDTLWKTLMHRMGEKEGTQAFLTILLLHQSHPAHHMMTAIQQALDKGACDPSAIELLLRQQQPCAERPEALTQLGRLHAYDVTPPSVTDYDQLLKHNRGESL